jgi:hypothetical protein
LPIVYQKTVELTRFPLNNKPAFRFGQRKFITLSLSLQLGTDFTGTKAGSAAIIPAPRPASPGLLTLKRGLFQHFAASRSRLRE